MPCTPAGDFIAEFSDPVWAQAVVVKLNWRYWNGHFNYIEDTLTEAKRLAAEVEEPHE